MAVDTPPQFFDTPKLRYHKALSAGFDQDTVQAQAVQMLDDLYHALIKHSTQKPWYTKWFGTHTAPKGLYFWGGVGRGKTWLMDMFFEALPFDDKLRQHFHHFMEDTHKSLVRLSGKQNPLDTIADEIAKKYRVICFDEFFVVNVSDAMILGDLFHKLFARGVVLVATSNIPPNRLYENGIKRERFLPAIDDILAHTQVFNLDAGIDYRRRKIADDARFGHDSNFGAQAFLALTGDSGFAQDIDIGGRNLPILGQKNGVLWADFRALCMQPKGASDYIQIAKQFEVVIIDNVPHLDDAKGDAVRRFIYLIDELYDQRVLTFVQSADPILDLYSGQKFAFEIERTRSRLLEMQSAEYLEESRHDM